MNGETKQGERMKGKQEGNEERNLKMAGEAKGGKKTVTRVHSKRVNGYLGANSFFEMFFHINDFANIEDFAKFSI